jgi:uncharacterized protein YcfL
MVRYSAVWIALAVLAACSTTPREEGYKQPTVVAADVKSGDPSMKYTVERTGLEFQIDRGSLVGDDLLGGKVTIDRVTDNSSLGVLQADIHVRSRSSTPVYGLYRIVFYDDLGQPVGPVFSPWRPLAIDAPHGTTVLHETCSQRKAVYFVVETWQGEAQAKAEKPAAK